MDIIKLKATDIEQLLDSVLENYTVGDPLAIIMQKDDVREIHTAYLNADVGTKQVLLGHMQIDIVNDVILANYVIE